MNNAIKILFFIVPILLMVACSSKEWTYRYEGNSNNWNAVVDIISNEESGALFIGKIKNLTDKKVKNIHYEADLTSTSQQAGNIESPNLNDGYINLFQDVPNTDSFKQEFKNNVNGEKIKLFFGDYPIFKITWKDEQGEEYSETIQLKFVESN